MITQDDYQWLFRKAPAMAIAIGEDGRYLDVNDAFVERLGYSREHLIGRLPDDYVTPETLQRIKEEFRPALRRTPIVRSSTASNGSASTTRGR